jgi:hypothetical protein
MKARKRAGCFFWHAYYTSHVPEPESEVFVQSVEEAKLHQSKRLSHSAIKDLTNSDSPYNGLHLWKNSKSRLNLSLNYQAI